MKCEHGANMKECYFCAMRATHPDNPLQRAKEAEALSFLLARDRLVYGNSFEMDGRRIDPVRVRLNKDGTYTVLPLLDAEGREVSDEDDKPPIQWSATLIPTTRTLKSALKVTKEDLHNNDPIFPFSTRPSEVVEQITEIEDERILALLDAKGREVET